MRERQIQTDDNCCGNRETSALRVNLENSRLTQEGVVASMQTQYLQAKQEAEGADSLSSRNLLSRNEINNKKAAAVELTTRLRIEQSHAQLPNVHGRHVRHRR